MHKLSLGAAIGVILLVHFTKTVIKYVQIIELGTNTYLPGSHMILWME